MDEDAVGERARKAEAQREKEAGNAAYKARQFKAALGHYDKAAELDPTDISFLTNRCAQHPRLRGVLLSVSTCTASCGQAAPCRATVFTGVWEVSAKIVSVSQ